MPVPWRRDGLGPRPWVMTSPLGARCVVCKRGISISTFLGQWATLSVHKLASTWMSREDLRARGCPQGCCRGVTGPGWVIVLCAPPDTPIAYHPLLSLPSAAPLLVPSCGGRPEVVFSPRHAPKASAAGRANPQGRAALRFVCWLLTLFLLVLSEAVLTWLSRIAMVSSRFPCS